MIDSVWKVPNWARYICCGFCISILLCTKVRAQLVPTDSIPKQGIQNTVLPAVGYTSDLGLIGGGIYSRFDYRPGVEPYYSKIQAMVLASTGGYLEGELHMDWCKTFGLDMRSTLEFGANRLFDDNYFGVGNSTDFKDNRWNNGYYYFETVNFNADYTGRIPVWKSTFDDKLNALVMAGSEYNIPYPRKDQSTINLMPPRGVSGGWVNYIGTGLLWENRDSEIHPTRGNRLELKFKAAPSVLFNEYPLTIAKLDAREYFKFHLLRDVVVANRLIMRHANGQVPYWEMSALGNRTIMRGMPMNRYLGNSMIVYSLELRTWLINIKEYQIKLGGQLFTDRGRVFTPGDDFQDIFHNYRRTYGLGGAISLFNPDLIFRGDLGFSKDIMRIYMGIGYAF